jgi:hypothetical protein
MNLGCQNLLDKGKSAEESHVAGGAGTNIGDENLRTIDKINDLNTTSISMKVRSDLGFNDRTNEGKPLILF